MTHVTDDEQRSRVSVHRDALVCTVEELRHAVNANVDHFVVSLTPAAAAGSCTTAYQPLNCIFLCVYAMHTPGAQNAYSVGLLFCVAR